MSEFNLKKGQSIDGQAAISRREGSERHEFTTPTDFYDRLDDTEQRERLKNLRQRAEASLKKVR